MRFAMPPLKHRHRQQGAALLILLTMVVLAASYTLLTALNRDAPEILRDSGTMATLNEARDALIGWAMASTVRPGELPCPDTDNDGQANGTANCASYVGRLPWVTLGLSDLRDSAGERLWYVMDPAFDRGSANPVNSDTAASLVLDGAATGYAALVFAPGEALQGQARPAAAQNNINRYLEADNNDGDNNYVSSMPADFNDQVVGVEATGLLVAVERRVVQQMAALLDRYYQDNDYYPEPAPLGTTTCSNGTGQGHLPQAIQAGCAGQADWVDAPPAWFANDWALLTWYAPAPACIDPANPGCSGTGGLIQVTGTPLPDDDKRAIVIAAGAALPGQTRSPAPLALSDLLDITENTNLDSVFAHFAPAADRNDLIEVVAP